MSYERDTPNPPELSDKEIVELRAMIENDRRMKWLWASIRNLSVWVIGVITASTVGYQAFIDLVKGAVGK